VDIRTKLVFALVSVSLGSMLALGVLMYSSVETELRTQTFEQLDGLAEFKLEAVQGIVSGWHDRVSLVASRTQLHMSLAAYNRTGSATSLSRIQRILDDALGASPLFRQLWVHGPDGRLVADVGRRGGVSPSDTDVPTHAQTNERTQYSGVIFPDGEAPVVNLTAALVLESQTVGYLHAVLRADEIVALSANYEGLGDTGETMVVVEGEGGAPRILHPVRYAPDGGLAIEAGLPVNPNGPEAMGLREDGERFTENLLDYRGASVWAATRFVPETGWGVVVKVDTAEQAQPIEEFRRRMIRLAITLAAFAILFGTILGFRFAQPIHVLAEAANRIRAGELEARSDLDREDEVGLLARTFDEMASELESKVLLLTEFRKFFDMSLDMMCIATTDGYFRRVNAAFVRELGWSETELLQRPFLSLVHQDDVDATIQEIEKLSGGTPTISFENRFLCLDGSYKLLRWNSYPDEETGHLYAMARVRGARPAEQP
jgi:PAS domain S-box-containing protein